MKKRLGYNLNVIGHYLLIGWLIFFGVTIFVGLVTYLVMGANPNFVRGILLASLASLLILTTVSVHFGPF